jgi:hypothetical protein
MSGREAELLPFLELSRAELAGDPPLRGAATLASVRERALRHSLARKRRSRALFGMALAATFALVALVLLPRKAELSYRVTGVIDAEGRVLGGSKGANIDFTDGSRVMLEPGAQTRVHDLDESGARIRLEGRARVVIAKRPHADWAIEAGPYLVKVTGTSFDVRWSSSEQSLDVAMESGSVAVHGPLLSGDLLLEKGQQLSAVLSKRSVTVRDERALRRDPSPAPGSLPTAAAALPDDKARAKAVSGVDDSPPRHSWAEYVARGDFGAVIAEAEQRGLERTLESAAAGELGALADAARYGRRAEIATRALLAQRRRFPGTPIAQRAAFFLGQLSEGRGDALIWYERYLSESPRGPYVPQALGRKLMLIHERSGPASARPLCEEYLRRYPNGPYAAAAKKILDSRPGP